MKQSILKRALLTACLGSHLWQVWLWQAPVGPVIIPQAGDGYYQSWPDMTFTGISILM